MSGDVLVTRRRRRGELENAILGILNAAGEARTTREVRDDLDHELAYTTVLTALVRMSDKGVVERIGRGRVFAYRALTDEPGLAARRMHRILDAVHEKDTVLARFVNDLPGDDKRVLSVALARARRS